jgi:SAM-dependent methyltransferase
MNRYPIKSAWFDALTAGGTKSHYEWLQALTDSANIDKIVVFGCCSAEPLILLWLFDATRVAIVELVEENILLLQEDREALSILYPESLQEREIELVIPHDMSIRSDGLQSEYYDLAYCERVLYNMSPDFNKIQMAVNEMARVVKSGGFVIAADELVNGNGANRRDNLVDINYMFESLGLRRINLLNAPNSSYCYQKP